MAPMTKPAITAILFGAMLFVLGMSPRNVRKLDCTENTGPMGPDADLVFGHYAVPSRFDYSPFPQAEHSSEMGISCQFGS
jgi:hypothetical protein